MSTTIAAENNITAHAARLTGTDESQSFSTAKELAKRTADWPVTRLVDAWNSFAGVTPFDDLKPVKSFTSRKAVVARIWQAVTRLSPDGAQPGCQRRSRQGQREEIHGQGCGSRPGARGRKRETAKGATAAEIMAATNWQAHTVRGFVSILGSKGGEKIESTKNAAGERTNKIEK